MTIAPDSARRTAAGTARRPRVLLAPITITPSKPLTPSHLKGLLWTDVMFRATRELADVTYRYSPTAFHQTEQTLGFWEFLDRVHGDVDYDGLTEEEIGHFYVAFRSAGHHRPAEALRPYAQAAESGWVHPAGRRVLAHWTAHYAALGLHDPGLLAHQPPALDTEQMIRRLTALGLCLDLRDLGGPVYLDPTHHGMPLRQLITADGRPNYLACALRELIGLAPDFDEVVLLYDTELDADYQQLAHVVRALGPVPRRVPLGRTPIDGRIRSARHGGWEDCHAGALLAAAGKEHGRAAIRLGMRLYFIAVLGPGRQQSFRPDLLAQCLRRAERLLAEAEAEAGPGAEEALVERLAPHRRDHVYVDPYRLTSSLLGRRRRTPLSPRLAEVFS
ncbi:hypothetical protein LUW75_03830 [Streptomyces sp. MRC013]|uniref:hypothetical protein n=1 Tax=Streptomyces sp. MRC013 TaxID=2898276 RepID=UPI002026394C|nr:hypothetical protein [Streptomyces sp. MRC013]URM89281.1 hypothetical protein LUW75_03830 [Streptomyces sp. MRC013]